MSLLNSVLLVIHILAVTAILTLLIHKNTKAPHRLNPGVLHSAATALIAGVAMVGVSYPLHDQDPAHYSLPNNAIVGMKLVVVLAILVIGYANVKKPAISRNTWLGLIGLTLLNIVLSQLV